MLKFKNIQDKSRVLAYQVCIIIFIFFMILNPGVSAITVSPSYIEGGDLEAGNVYVFSFEFINRLSSSVPVNVVFELTQSSKYLEDNVMFFPSSLVINPEDSNIHFSVLIVGVENIIEDDHLLLFRPVPTAINPAEVNSTNSMNIASHILQTIVVGINFSIPSEVELIVPTTNGGGGSWNSIGDIISVQQKPIIEIIDETKDIIITTPWFFRVTQPNETLLIKIKNGGAVNFTDLVLDIMAISELDFVYDANISSLLLGEEKTIEINMSGFSDTYHFLSISISDGMNEWEKNVIVYVSEEPRESMSQDCILFEPKNIILLKNEESQSNLSILNVCNFSLHNLNVIVAGLNHIEHIGNVEPNKKYVFDITVPKLKEHIDYPILFVYDEGKSADEIHVDLIKSSKYLYYMLFLVLAVFGIFAYLTHHFGFFKNKILLKKIKVSEQKNIENKLDFPDQSEPIFNFENNKFVEGNKRDKQKK